MASRTLAPGGDAWSTLDPVDDLAAPPAEAGERYAPTGVLGEGATAQVIAAYDSRLHREVALKLLKRDTPGARARFVAEGQVAAQLEHPNILPIHDAGTDNAGRVYLAMKRIRGESLAELLTRDPPPLARRLDIFRKVCDAVAYAHAHGVIHRDLKPDNVMVGPYGEVLVADWGLARPIGAAAEAPIDVDRFHDDAQRTREGQIAGTPAYMAPEQAEGRLGDLDARSDVYGLGALLWHLLVGHAPFVGALDDVLADVRAGRVPSARAAVPSVPRELDLVARRAMARDPAARYPSAHALREDIDAWLDGRPLAGVRSSWRERLTKWATRHRRPLGAAAAVAAVALLGFSVATWRYVVDIGLARDAALRDSERATAAEQATARELVHARIALSDALASQDRASDARAALDGLSADAGDPALARELELVRAQRALESPPPLSVCTPHAGAGVRAVVLDPRGTRGASWGADGTLRTWAIPGCAELGSLQVGAGAAGPASLHLDDAGLDALLVVGDQLVRVEDGVVQPGAVTAPPLAQRVGVDARSPWVSTSAGVWRWTPTGLEPDRWTPDDGAHWAPGADGTLRVTTSTRTGGEAGGAWSLDGHPRWKSAGVNDAAATADGRLLLVGTATGTRLVDLRTGQERWAAAGAPSESVGLAPGERYAWAAGFGGLLRVLRVEDGERVAQLGDGLGTIAAVATTPDARLLAGAAGSAVHVWLRPTEGRLVPGTGLAASHGLAVHPSGELYAVGDDAGRLELRDASTGVTLRRWDGFPDAVRQIAFSPDGKRLAAALRLYGLAVFDVDTGATLRMDALATRTVSVAWADDRTVVTADVEGGWWTLVDGAAPRRVGKVLEGATWQVTPLGGGRLLVAGHVGAERVARVVDAEGHKLHEIPDDADTFQAASHGDLVALGRGNGTVLLWDLASGRVDTLKADDGPTLGVAFSADGTLLATTGYGRSVRLWDPQTRTLLRTIPEHQSPGVAVRFLPDAPALLSSSLDGVRRLPLAQDRTMAEALVRFAAGGAEADRAAADLGWWERIGAGAEPRLRARARLAAGDLDGAVQIAVEAPDRGALLAALAGLHAPGAADPPGERAPPSR